MARIDRSEEEARTRALPVPVVLARVVCAMRSSARGRVQVHAGSNSLALEGLVSAAANSPLPDPTTVRVWREGAWWRADPHEGWIGVASQPTSAQWAAAPSERAPELGPLAQAALSLSSGQPIAVLGADGRVVLFTSEWGGAGARVLVGGRGQAALPALPPPPLVVVLRPHPGGMKGVRKSTEYVRLGIAAGRHNPFLIAWTRRTIHAANLPDARGFPNADNVVRALFDAQKHEMAFVKDPRSGEMMANPAFLLCLDPNGLCLRGGDCDDQLILLGSSSSSAGVPIRLDVRRYAGSEQAHITLQYQTPSGWKCIDPSTDSGACSSARFVEQIIVPIESAETEGGTFVGLGSLGAPADRLPEDLALLWTDALHDTHEALCRAADRLRKNAGARAALGGDLGLPPDEQTMGETSRLLATAEFLSAAIAEGLAGRRELALATPANDLSIGPAAGDAYALAIAEGEDGAPVPVYVDAGGPSSLAAALEVAKMCDEAASAHYLDARGTLSGLPSTLGLATPGDVLSYRNLWNDYVVGTARAAAACGAAWQALSDGTTPATPPNVAEFAVPPDTKTLALWATSNREIADSIMGSWNQHAGLKDWEIVASAAEILQDFQKVVRDVGTFYQPQIARDCPSLPLPTPPSLELQKQVIGQIEGLGILAHGVLQLFELGAGGALEAYHSIGEKILNPTTLEIGGVGVVLGVAATLAGLYLLSRAGVLGGSSVRAA
jgi:hypothetical protein